MADPDDREEEVAFAAPADWAYLLGVLGGIALAGGALAMLVALVAPGLRVPPAATAVGMGSGLGMLAVTWLALLRRHGGIGPLAGDIALGIAITYAQVHEGDVAAAETAGMGMLFGLSCFALGHLFLRDWPARIAAAVAFVAVVVDLGFEARHVAVPSALDPAISVLVFGGVAGVGVALARRISLLGRSGRTLG